MKSLLPFLLTFSLYGAEKAHHHKDLVITVHQESPEEEKTNQIPVKSCCPISNCDIRLKVALIVASVGLLTTITSTTMAIIYHCD